MTDLREIADAIPELGGGGKTMADRLIELASKVPRGRAVVDIAPWLGSSSAYLALGILKAGSGNTIHAFDRWAADREYVAKAKKYHGLKLKLGQDLLRTVYAQNMRQFPVPLVARRGDVEDAEWSGAPIGLLVDDISFTADRIVSTMRTFGPSIVPGGFVVLMDWGFGETRDMPAQRNFMARNGGAFKMVERMAPPSPAAVFVRLGGSIVL